MSNGPETNGTNGADLGSRHSALLALALAYLGIVALCLPFALDGTDVPGWLLLVGRWLPALASLVALLLLGQRGALVSLWRLRPGGWRRLALSYAVAVGTMAAALAVPAVVVSLVVDGASLAGDVWFAALPLLAFGALVLVASTLGEEVFWRGHLQSALAGLGFWRSSLVVGGLWVLWHLPLHGLYWAQGTLPTGVLLASTMGLLAWAPLLAALVRRFGSVWPAAFAHAVPVSSYQLLQTGARDDVALAAVAALHATALLGAAWLLTRSGSGSDDSGTAETPTAGTSTPVRLRSATGSG